nr:MULTISPECIES: Gfo/Idh/MocA family oxidoreductase [unclassified Actinomyces]
MRTAVVGAGQRFTEVVPAAAAAGRLEVVAVVDPSPAARERAAALLPAARLHADLDSLLAGDVPGAGAEAALVLTPDWTHAEVGTALLRSGLHVLVDKPLATTIEGADALLAAAEASGRLLYAGHNMRFMPVVEVMRQVVEDGLIGTPRAFWVRHFVGRGGDYFFRDWHAESALSGGLLVHKACHDLDAMSHVLGTSIQAVQAIGTNAVYHGCEPRPEGRAVPEVVNDVTHWPPSALTDVNPAMDVEDLSLVNLVCSHGVLGAYQQCCFTPDYWRSYTVIGDAGRMENVGDSAGEGEVLVWNRRRHGFDAEPDLRLPLVEGRGATAPVCEGRSGAHDAADAAMLADFAAAVLDGTAPRTSARTARDVVAAGVLARRSMHGGGLLPVPEPRVGTRSTT